MTSVHLRTRPASKRISISRHVPWFIAVVLTTVGLTTSGCASPPIELEARVVTGLPEEIDADAVGDLDWFVFTSDDVEALEVVPFDQKAGGAIVTGATATLDGDGSLVLSGVSTYHWRQGENYQSIAEIAPGVGIQLWDEAARGELRVGLGWSRQARRLILHGRCSGGTTKIEAQVGEASSGITAIDCSGDEHRSWSYELTVTNPTRAPGWVAVRTTSPPDPFASVAVSGAFISATP